MLKLLVFVLLVAAVIFAFTRRAPPNRPPRDPPRDVDPTPLLPASLAGPGRDDASPRPPAGENNEMVTGDVGDGADGGDSSD
jgi:hypothetical protein